MKIIVTERIAEEGIQFLIDQGHQVDTKFGISHEDLLGIIGEYDAIIVRSVTKVNKELLEKADNLKVAGRAGNGIDNIDVPACTEKGIIVVNTPESNTMSAAELAIGHAFAIFRNIPQANHAGKFNKDFRRNLFNGNEVDNKTVGVIGLGRIGSIVARKLKGCNMRAIAYDPYIPDENFKRQGVEKCETLDELLAQSDLITLHTPKTKETYKMIGEKEIAKCKDGVRIVNAARGGLVDEEALYNAIVSGKVRAAALDVLDPEPNYDTAPEDQTYTNKLLELDNVIVSPHIGASTEEATYNVGTTVARLVNDALANKPVAAVNMPSMGNANMEDMKAYLELGEILGRIYYQVEKGTVNKIEVVYSGDVFDGGTKIITYSVLKGFLEPVVKEMVNYINADTLLKQRGIVFTESHTSSSGKYTNLISVKFTTKEKELTLSGTVFGNNSYRIVDFFGYEMEFEPMKCTLALQNVDVPGIIGKVGTALGEENINIRAMQWSRNSRHEKAISFIGLEQDVDDSILEKLREIDGVLKASKFI